MARDASIRVLTWNLFHGQDGTRLGPTVGSTLLRRGVQDGVALHLNRKWTPEMAEIIDGRQASLVALQEVPPLAVPALERATGMQAVSSLMRPLVGPVGLRGRLAERNPDLWRTHEGTANVLLVGSPFEVVPGGSWTVRHNPASLVARYGRRLRLGCREWLHWLLEPRRLVAVRVRDPAGRTLTAVSMHCHNSLVWEVIGEEMRRILPRVLERVPPDESVLVAGDLNAAGREHPAIRALHELGFREDTVECLALDHIFHRRLRVVDPPTPLGREVREIEVAWRGSPRLVLLSDHDPVEATYRFPAG